MCARVCVYVWCVCVSPPQVSAALGGESKALSSSLDAYTLRMLTADIEAHLTGLKNAVYAMGYVAGKDEVVAHAQRKFA